MSQTTQDQPVPTQTKFISVNGVRVAMRSYGAGQPLVLLQRFRGTIDYWDPAFLMPMSRGRRVISFDSLGVGETGGETPRTVEAAADFTAGVIRALSLGRVDVLGWSLGGMTAQVLALNYPDLVRKLVLAATMPPAGSPEVVWRSEWLRMASIPWHTAEGALALFFTKSEASRSAGVASFGRLVHPPASEVSLGSFAAQAEAITRFAADDQGWYARLRSIKAPTFVANGDLDGLFPAIDSAVLAREIASSRLAIYPDSGHAFLFQYPERFAEDSMLS